MRSSIRTKAAEYVADVEAADAVERLTKVTESVDSILAQRRSLEHFHGKRLLRSFYQKHNIASTGMGWNAFLTELARQASEGERVSALVGTAVNKIKLYFPPELVGLLTESAKEHPDAQPLADRAAIQRTSWETGTPSDAGREALRSDVFTLARAIAANIGAEAAEPLFRAASAIGTP